MELAVKVALVTPLQAQALLSDDGCALSETCAANRGQQYVQSWLTMHARCLTQALSTEGSNVKVLV